MKEYFKIIAYIRTKAFAWIREAMTSRGLTEINNIRLWTDEGKYYKEYEDSENNYESLVEIYTIYAEDVDGYNTIPCELNRIVLKEHDIDFYGDEVYGDGEFYVAYVSTMELLDICEDILKPLLSEYDKGRIKKF